MLVDTTQLLIYGALLVCGIAIGWLLTEIRRR